MIKNIEGCLVLKPPLIHRFLKTGEPVVFFIPSTFDIAGEVNQKTLLALNMEHQFKDYFEVCSVRRRPKGIDYLKLLELIQSEKYRNHHIFIDEIHIETIEDIEIIKDIADSCQNKTLWLSVTSMGSIGNESFADAIKLEFGQQFVIPDDLLYPLRQGSITLRCK